MFKGMFEPLSPEEQARKDRVKAAQRTARNLERARQQEIYQERLANLPHFRVRQVREVLVQAEDMQGAIALASAAFKEGQDSDHTIKWGKPFGVEGDTRGPIRVVDVRAVEDYFEKVEGPHSQGCTYVPHEHGIRCFIDCPTCGGI